MSGGRRRRQHGCLEFLAQAFRLVWPAGDIDDIDNTRVEDIVLGPSYLADGTADSLGNALGRAVPGFDVKDLLAMTSRTKFVLLVLASDLGTPCVRLKGYVKHLACGHNSTTTEGHMIVLDPFCTVHVSTRAVMCTMGMNQLIPRVFSLAFATRFPPRLNRLFVVLANAIERDLAQGGFFLNLEPSLEEANHVQKIWMLTVRRPLYTKGRDELSEHAVRRIDDYLRILRCITGDVRRLRVVHNCPTWCRCPNARAAAVKICDALLQVFCDDLAKHLPSTSKWWTQEPCMIPQSALSLLFDLLGRVVPEAFLTEAAADGDNDEDDFHAKCRRRVKQACEASADPNHRVELLSTLWSCRPLDKLTATFQHLDYANVATREEMDWPDGPIRQAQVDYYRMLTDTTYEHHIAVLPYHFELDPRIDTFDVECRARNQALALSSQIWSRLPLEFADESWALIKCGRPGLTEEGWQAGFKRFKGNNKCCLYQSVGVPLMTAEDSLLHGIVRALYESVPGTNIPLEGLLALMKHSVGLRPHTAAEKLGHLAFLTQLLKRHVSACLADMRGKLSQTELIARGVPIRAAAKRAGARQHTPRYHIAFANNKMSSWHELNPDAGFDASFAARREAIREWSSMDEIAKQEFIESVKQSELADEDAKMDAEMEADHPAPSVWQRCLASDEWPLKAEHIER